MKGWNFLIKAGYLFIKPIKFLRLDFRFQIIESTIVLVILSIVNSLAVFYLEKPSNVSNDFASRLAASPLFGAAADSLLTIITLFITSYIFYLTLKYIFRVGIGYKQSILLTAISTIPSMINNIYNSFYQMYTGLSIFYNHQGTFIHQISVYVNLFTLWKALLLFFFLKYYLKLSKKRAALLTVICIIIPIIIHIVAL